MRAVGFTTYGGPEVIGPIELPIPEPGPGQVRVRVHAAVVNPADVQFRRGDHAALVAEANPPYCGGLEFVGTLDAAEAGAAVTVGTLVGGTSHFIPTGRGAHAEYVVTGADSVVPCPDGADPVAMATVPMNGLTARVVLDTLALSPGATVLVTGAAGAVGGYVTELAARAGLRVIALAAPQDEGAVRACGAAEFLPRGDDVAARVRATHPDGVAAVVDAAMVGEAVMPAVATNGRFIALRPGHVPAPQRGISPELVSFRRCRDPLGALRELVDLAAAGRLTTRVAGTFPLDEGPAAFALADAPGLRGRVVLRFDDA